jgi:hexosaminidase
MENTQLEPRLIPRPVEMTAGTAAFRITPETGIFYEGTVAEPAARLLAELLRPATGFPLPVFQKSPSDSQALILRILDEAGAPPESYVLEVSDARVEIRAPQLAGLFHGVQSLRQLLPPGVFQSSPESCDWVVPPVILRDYPRFGWRGMHLDVSRHFIPKADVLRFLDTIASLKINRFHWHLTDDQGWRIEIKKYPRLTEIGAWRKETLIGHAARPPEEYSYDAKPHGGFYTQEDIREVVRFATARGITIIPEIDMPGHMQAAIAAYPELGSSDAPVTVWQAWGVSPCILNPEEATLDFCRDVLTEVMALFPGELIHIGGDEAEKGQWENNPRVQQLREERGLKDMAEMQHWFIRQLEVFLNEQGRKLIGWNEILEGGALNDATIIAWRGTEYAVAAAGAGYPVVIACQHLYFDHYQAQPTEDEPLAICGYTPLDAVYAHEIIPADLPADQRKNILGAQGQIWTEYMPTVRRMEDMAFPRVCALAEAVWTPPALKNYEDFLHRLPAELRRLDCAGVQYRAEWRSLKPQRGCQR